MTHDHLIDRYLLNSVSSTFGIFGVSVEHIWGQSRNG